MLRERNNDNGNETMIKTKIRNEFASLSTGSKNGKYYETKGEGVNRFDDFLQQNDLYLTRAGFELCSGWNGDEGRKTIDIVDENDVSQGCAVFSWFRMESGRYEFIGYIA